MSTGPSKIFIRGHLNYLMWFMTKVTSRCFMKNLIQYNVALAIAGAIRGFFTEKRY